MAELTIRNPVAELNAAPTPRAPRLADLTGSRVGLWWNKKIGGETALEFLGADLTREFGSSTEEFYDSFPAHKGMTARCAEASTVVIGATGD